jgi:hypothetical protein
MYIVIRWSVLNVSPYDTYDTKQVVSLFNIPSRPDDDARSGAIRSAERVSVHSHQCVCWPETSALPKAKVSLVSVGIYSVMIKYY